MWVYDLPSSEYKLHKRGNLVAHTKNLLTVHRNEPLAICSQPINQSSNPLMWLFTPLYNILPNRIQLTWLPMGQYRNCKVWLKRLGHKIDSDCCLYLKLFTLGSQAPFHSSRPWRSLPDWWASSPASVSPWAPLPFLMYQAARKLVISVFLSSLVFKLLEG